jgi:hypothetical protein
VPFLLKDVSTEDHELLCASLRLLQILPGSVVFVCIMLLSLLTGYLTIFIGREREVAS